MSIEVQFDEEAQKDLLAAAARLYEANMLDVCMSILAILIKCDNASAHVLYGHCISNEEYKYAQQIANDHYKIACEMGSAVGCYNLYMSYAKKDNAIAENYLEKAKNLGWKD